MTKVHLVCFDLGGVVIKICRSWAEGCAAAGIRHDEIAESPDVAAAVAVHCRRHHSGDIDAPTFAQCVADAMRGVYHPEEILAVHHAWLGDEYDGVAGLIDRVHACGCETAILSNTNDAHWDRIVDYPSVRRVRRLFASHLLGTVKPDEDAFRAVEHGCGCKGKEIIFFDDTEINITTAQSLGWRAAQIEPDRPTTPQIEAVLNEIGVLG